MQRVYLNGKMIRLDPSQALGKGGEADVFDIGNHIALKLFKPPSHPDLQGHPAEQIGAEQRIATHQTKLKNFPQNLPAHVITPIDLATDSSGHKILGYTMRIVPKAEVLLRYADKPFRQAGVSNDTVNEIFIDLHTTVRGIHRAGVVIGDFNDLNVLVSDTEAYVIDADSFQFGSYPCTMYTARFVDPLLCDPKNTSLHLVRQHNENSDWYAFTVMLMQCLLFVDPYGGVYKPKNPANRILHTTRPLQRITVFHPDVKYPKPAIPYTVLPDSLLHFFHQTFEKDKRGEFPFSLLQELRWIQCPHCGTEHARLRCPVCSTMVPTAVLPKTTREGKVVATKIFTTSGSIIFAVVQNNQLMWLYNENGSFKREDGTEVLAGDHDPYIRYRISGSRTLLAKNGRLVTISAGSQPEVISVDTYGSLPIFDANGQYRYWTYNGELMREGQMLSNAVRSDTVIGDVLSKQTLFWVGPSFGFGFYRAGNLSVAFVFDAMRGGINDSITLPPIRGQLLDSTCVFTEDLCWFLLTIREGGKTVNRCVVINKGGKVETVAESLEGDGSWLGTLRGKCAIGPYLFTPTDEGIVRVQLTNGLISNPVTYKDTEAFLGSDSNLFISRDGIFAVSQHEIYRLQIT